MSICSRCGKGKQRVAYSRHRKGHGIGGVWALRAPIHKRVQKPNLHVYQGQKYCTKCLRMVKPAFVSTEKPQGQAPAA